MDKTLAKKLSDKGVFRSVDQRGQKVFTMSVDPKLRADLLLKRKLNMSSIVEQRSESKNLESQNKSTILANNSGFTTLQESSKQESIHLRKESPLMNLLKASLKKSVASNRSFSAKNSESDTKTFKLLEDNMTNANINCKDLVKRQVMPGSLLFGLVNKHQSKKSISLVPDLSGIEERKNQKVSIKDFRSPNESLYTNKLRNTQRGVNLERLDKILMERRPATDKTRIIKPPHDPLQINPFEDVINNSQNLKMTSPQAGGYFSKLFSRKTRSSQASRESSFEGRSSNRVAASFERSSSREVSEVKTQTYYMVGLKYSFKKFNCSSSLRTHFAQSFSALKYFKAKLPSVFQYEDVTVKKNSIHYNSSSPPDVKSDSTYS